MNIQEIINIFKEELSENYSADKISNLTSAIFSLPTDIDLIISFRKSIAENRQLKYDEAISVLKFFTLSYLGLTEKLNKKNKEGMKLREIDTPFMKISLKRVFSLSTTELFERMKILSKVDGAYFIYNVFHGFEYFKILDKINSSGNSNVPHKRLLMSPRLNAFLLHLDLKTKREVPWNEYIDFSTSLEDIEEEEKNRKVENFLGSIIKNVKNISSKEHMLFSNDTLGAVRELEIYKLTKEIEESYLDNSTFALLYTEEVVSSLLVEYGLDPVEKNIITN